MTQIAFLHGAADRIQAAADWLHQAYAEHQEVLVFVPDEMTAERLDRVLWAHPALSFTPHCRGDAPLAAETPIVLAQHLAVPLHKDCLLNLSNELPASWSEFAQVVEIVSTDDRDRVPARDRFKIYRECGHEVKSRDISGGL